MGTGRNSLEIFKTGGKTSEELVIKICTKAIAVKIERREEICKYS